MDKLIIITKTMGLHQITTPKVSSCYYHCDDDKKIAKFVELTGQIICDEIIKAVKASRHGKIVDVDYTLPCYSENGEDPSFSAEYYTDDIRNTVSIRVYKEPIVITDTLLEELENTVNRFKPKWGEFGDKFMEINDILLKNKEK